MHDNVVVWKRVRRRAFSLILTQRLVMKAVRMDILQIRQHILALLCAR